MPKSLITCSCAGSLDIDTERLSQATGLDVTAMGETLCMRQISRLEEAVQDEDAIICCTQEARRFTALAEEFDAPPPAVLDLRDRAGWTADEGDLIPKMSALAAEAVLPLPGEKTVDITSEGICLILGPYEVATSAAEQLKDLLNVTVVIGPDDPFPDTRAYDAVVGTGMKASGTFGAFEVRFDRVGLAFLPGDGPFEADVSRPDARSACDIILDLTGSTPLFPPHREGYLRADPKHPPSVFQAILEASHLTGTFEQPLYVKTEPLLCAHSRAEQTGCTRCLDLCPTGAITPNGDYVKVDPLVCAGCGACSAVCPSGAISYDAPPVDFTMRRVQTLAKAYQDAGGSAPRLLVHDAHGAEMIRLAARHGRGLPADVIPLEMGTLGGFGHAEIVAALAAGFASVTMAPGPETDRAAMQAQIDLASALGGAVSTFDEADPDALSDMLFAEAAPTPVATPVRPMGTRRQITRAATKALNPEAEAVALPEGAPYGAVLVNTEACTLCLSCVSLCPSGALGDNPDLPQLRFQEDACLQCGLCASVCPEDAIAYEPRLNLNDAALSQQVLNEEEPFACVECGTLFGSKSTIERITEKLKGHSMFADPERLRMIQMCDNCRVNAQYHSTDNPFAGGERPRVRTTDDYLSKRRDH
ncbi:Iron-sulfur cluster-binding protein [Candidatus Rhodobacter oscarellae]|uniref:Iron-sulfur cluster-binding protein n=1 Tax=Candidatus Rhodobacter oscarellae TaxID=1675527 RepID=A0A0J9E1G5_9RHOB|nr:4Fe-4S binding protein [Candidatus Rhodobacter lobularis]KMW56532.1 Iron-sulfur cluster-binding protein [Candidatus Rhodobacter lobularis]